MSGISNSDFFKELFESKYLILEYKVTKHYRCNFVVIITQFTK